MNNKIYRYALIYLILMQTAFCDTITLIADEWCPYNCEANSQSPGYMIEVAKKVFTKEGHEVIYLTGLSWEDAIVKSRNNEYNAIVGAARVDAPDFIFPENEIGISQMSFIINAQSTWSYNGLESLEEVKLGAIVDYSYNEEIDAYIQKNKDDYDKVQLISGNKALSHNMQKLLRGMISTLIDDTCVIKYFFKSNEFTNPFKFIEVTAPSKSYIAFSPKNDKSQEYANILSKGIERLRENGELEIILQKYGLDDWK